MKGIRIRDTNSDWKREQELNLEGLSDDGQLARLALCIEVGDVCKNLSGWVRESSSRTLDSSELRSLGVF